MDFNDWSEKYNDNYLRLIKESKHIEEPAPFINAGIVEFVVEHIKEAKVQYYIEGSDYMDDATYDRFERILEIHHPDHPLLQSVGTAEAR
jgi:hypothetical protein